MNDADRRAAHLEAAITSLSAAMKINPDTTTTGSATALGSIATALAATRYALAISKDPKKALVALWK